MDARSLVADVIHDDDRPVTDGDILQARKRIDRRLQVPELHHIPGCLLLQRSADPGEIAELDLVGLGNQCELP
jgi:hypothetical protein